MVLKTIPDDRFELSGSTPLPLRIGLGAVGAFIAFVVTKDLWRGAWPPTILSPFFLIIMGGGLFIGGGLVAAMVWAPDENWVIAKGRVTITRTLRNFRSERTHKTAEINAVEVATTSWDSGPDTYSLEITLTTDKKLRSPSFKEKAQAEAARRLLMGFRG